MLSGYLSANVGLCSTYSSRTRSGSQTNTASVFGASTKSCTSMSTLLGRRPVVLRRVDEHREVVQQRRLGVSRLALVELDEGAGDLDARRAVRLRAPRPAKP